MGAWTHAGVPLDQRSKRQLFEWIALFPPFGVVILGFAIVNAVEHWREFNAIDWFFKVTWVSFLAIFTIVGPPAIAWRELQRRKRERNELRTAGKAFP